MWAGEPIDKILFETVGEEFGVGIASLHIDLYYEVKAYGGPGTADWIEDWEDANRLSKIAPVTIIKWGRSVTFQKDLKKPGNFTGKLKNIREY